MDSNRIIGGEKMEDVAVTLPSVDEIGDSTDVPHGNPQPEVMTIFYRKKTGEIKELMSDDCDMSVFGEEREDYELIWDFIVIEMDEVVKNNKDQFVVDLETKELIYTPLVDTSKYKMR